MTKLQTSIIQKINIDGNIINISVSDEGVRLSTKRIVDNYRVTMRRALTFKEFIEDVNEQVEIDKKSDKWKK
jgi:hypothetical protein